MEVLLKWNTTQNRPISQVETEHFTLAESGVEPCANFVDISVGDTQ
jgi:hypothetical protein